MKPVPQELYCEDCGEQASADDWIDGLQALICPRCLESYLENANEPRCEVGLVGGGYQW